ncbi:MAG: hypothetical protein KAT77_02200 [Nanoarchaeota archaeon]|nr:hypothetical protein [Nanoarchaeota archaeon]
MKTDIVLPSGNENEFIELGRRLGFEKLIFVYEELSDFKVIESELKIDYCVLVSEKNKKNLVKKINKIKQKGFLVLVKAEDEKFNRFVLERTRVDMIYGLELSRRKDAMHYRRSGLDQVLCKIAKERGKKVVFSLKEIFNPLVLGRMIQNIKFCKKYKVNFLFGSFAEKIGEMRSEHDLKWFVRLLQQKFLYTEKLLFKDK